jgi:hypothetical protein
MPKGRRKMSRTKAPPPTQTKSPSSKPPAKAPAPKANLKLVEGNKALLLADKKTRANPDAMRKAAKELGVEIPKTRGEKATQELLGNLRVEIEKRLATVAVDDHVKCVVCDEVALDKPPFCPFCGDEGGDPTHVVTEEQEAIQAELDEESSEETSEDEEIEGVGITKTAVPAAANIEVANAQLEKDLEERLERIRALKQSVVGMSYDIGLECREIRDRQLFKARGYTSFKAFAERELPFTRESALQLVSIVEKHTREDYDQIGYAKLRVIGSVSDGETKAELMSAARSGATTKQLAARASGGSTAPTAASKKPAPAEEKGEKITLIGKIGARNQVVKFHDADSDGELVDSAGVFKSFTASAYGELEVADGVFLRVGLRVNDKKELEGLTVRFVRAADAAE